MEKINLTFTSKYTMVAPIINIVWTGAIVDVSMSLRYIILSYCVAEIFYWRIVMIRGNISIEKKKLNAARSRWRNMLQRCLDPDHKHYDNYGGRGIIVCDRWMDFDLFYQDVGDCPEGMSLDRTNNNLGYNPDNWRWATPQTQTENRSHSPKMQKKNRDKYIAMLKRNYHILKNEGLLKDITLSDDEEKEIASGNNVEVVSKDGQVELIPEDIYQKPYDGKRLAMLNNKYEIAKSEENIDEDLIYELEIEIETEMAIHNIKKPKSRTMDNLIKIRRVWDRMNTACYDKTNFSYLHGIRICGRWLTFENFLSDMGECRKGLTIQRFDITKDFTPDNCCWSTKEGMEAVQHLKGADRDLRIAEINKRVISSYSEINIKDWW